MSSYIVKKLSTWCLAPILLLMGVTITGCSQPEASLAPASIHRYVEDNLIDATLSTDSQLTVTLSRTRELSVWDNISKTLQHQWQAHNFDEPNYLIALSGNKRFLAAAGKSRLSIFDLTTGQLTLSWLAQGFDKDASISSLFLSKTGNQVLIGMNEGSLLSINLRSNQLSKFQLHKGPVSHVEFIAHNEQLLSAAHDGHLIISASSNGKIIKEFNLPQRLTSVSFDQANRRLFISDAIDNHLIADSLSGESISKLTFLERYRYFRQALFAERGKTLITASSKQKIMVWDLNSGKETKHWSITAFTAGTTVLDMVVAPNGQLVTISSDGALESWKYN